MFRSVRLQPYSGTAVRGQAVRENDVCALLLRCNACDLGFRIESDSVNARGQAGACPTKTKFKNAADTCITESLSYSHTPKLRHGGNKRARALASKRALHFVKPVFKRAFPDAHQRNCTLVLHRMHK